MARIFSVLALLFTTAAPAAAQDMPLSQILIDDAGWKKVREPGPKPHRTNANVQTYSADGGTRFFHISGGAFLWAEPVVEGGSVNFRGAPYAPLRTRRGESSIEVTGLATDRDGRIYAATEIGVQVFDPTGRLCGVLTPAAPGKSERLAFEGDTLTLWAGETKYARKLRTEGAK
ncbi:MAG: hypothetical protein J0I06_21655 [Planctomycetes bacterium]|nr:hypothetical protein [Planctomycetota bacterium]